MALAQDILSRIIRVEWPGGDYIGIYVDGRRFGSNAGVVPDQAMEMRVTCDLPLLDWLSADLQHPDLTEKLSIAPGNANLDADGRPIDPVPLFNVAPNLSHSFAFKTDVRSRSTTSTFHFIDRGLYGLIDIDTGVTVLDATNPFGTHTIPFLVDWTGNTSGAGGDPILYVNPPNSSNLARAIAQDSGLPSKSWEFYLISEEASHDESTSVTTMGWQGTRHIWLNWNKLKASARALGRTSVNFDFRWKGIGVTTSNFAGVLFMALYSKAEPFRKEWPVKFNGDLTTDQYFNIRIPSEFTAPGQTNWPAGGPAFFPPNFEYVAVERFPKDQVDSGFIADFTTGETKRYAGTMRATITLGNKDAPDPDDRVDRLTFTEIEWDY